MSAPRETFGGKVYTFGIVPPQKALPICDEIQKAMLAAGIEVGASGAAAAKAEEVAGSAGDDRKEVGVARARVAGALMRRLSSVDWIDRDGIPHPGKITMMTTMFEHVEVIDNGKAKPVTLDMFGGKLSVADNVFWYAIKINFGDVFFSAAPMASSPGEPSGG